MRIGILTGGGDCPGLNGVIRAVVRRAVSYGDGVIGFRDGWRGLLEDRTTPLDIAAVDGLLTRGGTTLGSARVAPERLNAELPQMRDVLATHGIDVLIPIGGEGTLTAAHLLSEAGVPILGTSPAAIDLAEHRGEFARVLDDAGLMQSRALGGSVLGVGKYLSPRLYVSYGVSLLGTGQVLTLKYLLARGFDIEIESSTIENRGSVNWRTER